MPLPPDDAFMVRRLREAGAIVLAKSNMAEFAFSPYETVGSFAAGLHVQPVRAEPRAGRLERRHGGGGRASLGTVGLGTDTGNSIRGPSSHTRWSASGRPSGSPAAPASCRSTSSATWAAR
jgi:amidase